MALRVPNLRDVFGALETREFVPQWDSNNINYWAYLAFCRYLPFRDFWYPYSGFYLFNIPAPTGLLIKAAFEGTSLSLFLLALGRLYRRRLVAPLLITLFLVLGDTAGLFPNLFRYLLSANVLLAYVGIDREREGWQPAPPVLGRLCSCTVLRAGATP